MKIMILTAATGGGHIRAAGAIEKYITEHTEHEARVFDTLKCIGITVDKTVCGGYRFLVQNAPARFGRMYKLTNRDGSLSEIIPKLNSLFSMRLDHIIKEYAPDIIISTHPFPTQMVSHLKGKGREDCPLICLMTDYGVHRAWVGDNVDAYVVAHDDVAEKLSGLGVSPEKIYSFGIPVMSSFYEEYDKSALLSKMGLVDGLPTLLFMAGSFGVENILGLYKELESLKTLMQLIVITGRNKKLYDAFKDEIKDSPIRTHLIFYTSEVEEAMHAADLIVTKPGGLTVSEALACCLPVAACCAIPGQEDDNASFLERHGMGIRIEDNSNFSAVIRQLLEDTTMLEEMRKSCGQFNKSQALPSILHLAENLYFHGNKFALKLA